MNTWKSQDLNPNLPTANAELILLVLSGSQSKGGYWILHVMILTIFMILIILMKISHIQIYLHLKGAGKIELLNFQLGVDSWKSPYQNLASSDFRLFNFKVLVHLSNC